MEQKNVPEWIFVPEKNLLRKMIRAVSKAKNKAELCEKFNARWNFLYFKSYLH